MNLVEAWKMRGVVWVWNHTPNCAEMSRLASLALEQPLSLRMRFKVWLHHLICVWCKRYAHQLKFLHRAAPRLQNDWEQMPSHSLSDEAKHRMAARLQWSVAVEERKIL